MLIVWLLPIMPTERVVPVRIGERDVVRLGGPRDERDVRRGSDFRHRVDGHGLIRRAHVRVERVGNDAAGPRRRLEGGVARDDGLREPDVVDEHPGFRGGRLLSERRKRDEKPRGDRGHKTAQP
jgi:hypothetical protein